MAFLVCYSTNPTHDHPGEKAIYLSQELYESIFNTCRSLQKEFPILASIASLRYHSPTITIEANNVTNLHEEIVRLPVSKNISEISHFRSVCESALHRKCDLTVCGDMHPELS